MATVAWFQLAALVLLHATAAAGVPAWQSLKDITTWRYPVLEELAAAQKFEPRSRVWDRGLLKHGSAVLNYEQMRPLVRKLERGERIVITAIGSSMVADFAGCWGSPAQVQTVVGTLHYTYHKNQRCANTNGSDINSAGWVHGLLTVVNQTWPHKDHIFVNVGSGGHPFNNYADQGCLDSHIPGSVDLIILEQNESAMKHSSSINAERFLWRLNVHSKSHFIGSGGRPQDWQPPAIIMLNTISVTDHGSKFTFPCMQDGNQCDTTCNPFEHTLLDKSIGVKFEDVYLPLLQYFGYTSISLRNFYNALLRDQTLERIGHTPCKFLAAMVEDSMHPDPLGRVLFADMLVNHLVEALELFEITTSSLAHRPGIEGHRLPPKPLNLGGDDVLLTRCYGAIEQQRDDEFVSGESHGFHAMAGTNTLSELKVLQQNGWEFIEYQVHGAQRKYKPGWVATTPGATMQIELDTRFDRATPDQRATIVLMYLQSYEHMGRASVSCIRGCACDGGTIDAHNAHEHISVIHWAKYAVTQSPNCVLQIQVLEGTSSGENKFKLAQVAITIKVEFGSRTTSR